MSLIPWGDVRVTEDTMSKTDNKAAADMTEAMEKTMQRLQGRFQAVSAQLESKNILFLASSDYEMGTRIDDLEKNVAELMTQAGMEEQAISK
ncbi:heat shock factor-binding protein 1-like protein 1 [Symphorus nematophorus]